MGSKMRETDSTVQNMKKERKKAKANDAQSRCGPKSRVEYISSLLCEAKERDGWVARKGAKIYVRKIKGEP